MRTWKTVESAVEAAETTKTRYDVVGRNTPVAGPSAKKPAKKTTKGHQRYARKGVVAEPQEKDEDQVRTRETVESAVEAAETTTKKYDVACRDTRAVSASAKKPTRKKTKGHQTHSPKV